MKKLILIFLFSVPFLCFGQDLILTGKVYSIDAKGTGKVYFTNLGKKFSSQKFITFDNDHNYVFKINIKKILTNKIKTIVFSMDTSVNSTDENACVHKINVGEILNYKTFKNAKTIKLKTDLDLDFNCELSVYYGAQEDGNGKCIGQYTMQLNDTIRSITLADDFYRYTATLSKPTIDLMDKEYGAWEYDKEKKVLRLSVWKQMNDLFGLIIFNKHNYEFDVLEDSGYLQFKGINSTLIKN